MYQKNKKEEIENISDVTESIEENKIEEVENIEDNSNETIVEEIKEEIIETDPPRYMCIWNAYMLRCLQNGRSSSRSLEFEGNTGTS